MIYLRLKYTLAMVTWMSVVYTTLADNCNTWQGTPAETLADTCLPSTGSYVTLTAAETADCNRACLQRYPECRAANFDLSTSACDLFRVKNDSEVISPCPGVDFFSIDPNNELSELLASDGNLSEGICGSTNWQYWNGSCYQYIDVKQRFDYADNYCRARGSHLASIHSSLENRLVASLVDPGELILTGLIKESERAVRPNYRWTDGSPVDYINWQAGQPDGRPLLQSYCVLLDTGSDDMTWIDDNCYKPGTFVCKKIA